MSKDQKSDIDQREFWQMAIETCYSSGLTIRQFCKQEGLAESAFYSWRRKLLKTNNSETNKTEESLEPFIQVSMPQERPGILELVLISGNTLKIPHDIGSKNLTDVISALSKVGLC